MRRNEAQESTEGILQGLTEKVGGHPAQPSSPSPQGETTPHIGETYHRSLDDAATLLLNLLSPSIKDFLFELADVTLKIPRWQLLLGGVMAQYESGNSAAPSLDPSWRDMEVARGKSVCQLDTCGKEFTPKRFGQLYCSMECGDEIRRRKMEADHAARDKFEKEKAKFVKENPDQARLMGLV